MINSKTLIGGLTGGVLFFLLGYLIYGVLLSNFMAGNYNSCMEKPMEDFTWWAMSGSNLVWGFYLAIVLQWAKAENLTDGLKVGTIVGFLTSLAIGLSYWSMSTMYLTKKGAVVDVLISTVFIAVVAACISVAMNKFGSSTD